MQRGQSGGVGFPEDLDRNVQSLYGELFVPIFGDGNARPGARSLTLSLSGRYDHYSDFGSTTNPKVGLTWEPVDGVNLRGSYGRSFRAPGLRDLGSTVGSYYSAAALVDAFGARDPSRGAAQVNTILLFGGNQDLTPETARTWSFGVDLRPRFAPNLTASVTFYDIKYDDVIGTPSGLGALLFSDPTFASRVIRNPTAAQLNAAIAGHRAVLLHLRRGAGDRQHPRSAPGQFRRPQDQRDRLRRPLPADRAASARSSPGSRAIIS